MEKEKPSQKFLYVVKGWDGKEWKYLGHIYLNPFDSWEEKKATIKQLKKDFGDKYNYNVSNFSNVYL